MNVKNDDVILHVNVEGAGDRVVVLLHGMPLSGAVWRDQRDALAATARVVTIDLRGMGASSVPDGPYLMETLAGDVAAVLDALQIERATLVGHSLGGFVTLAFARMYSERLDALALVCSRVTDDAPERARWRMQVADELERCGDARQFVDDMLAASIPSARRNDAPLLAHLRAIGEPHTARGLAHMQRGMAMRASSADFAGDLAVPMLVVAGSDDPSLPLDTARDEASYLRSPRFVALECGHVPMLECPDELSELLLGLVSE